MWRTLSSRVYWCIAATLALGLFVSIVAVTGLRRTAATLDRVLDDNLPSVIAAGELEIALLEQRGCITSFIVSGGDQQWLDELAQRQKTFREWLQRAEDVAYTPEEQVVLAELSKIADRYDAQRRTVIELIRAGEVEKAKNIIFGDVGRLYEEAYSRCEKLNLVNQGLMREASRHAVTTVDWISGGVLAAIAAQIGLGGALLTIFYYSVLRPLRQMAIDLRHYVPAREGGREQLRDEVESVTSYLRLLLTDVADFQSRFEDQRRALFDAQKLASIGRLAAGLAHEIRNPLTAMKMWLFTARSAVTDRSDIAQTLDSVSQEIRRLEAIVRQFLEFSRPPETRLNWISTPELVSSSAALVEPLLHEKSIALKEQVAAELPRLFVDREQMIQVIVNLLRNAAESAPPGGEIVLTVSDGRDSNGLPEAILRVCDNGPGIPAPLQAKVFEPFFTTKEGGTGLGLSIVASIILRHGGSVKVESRSEVGAVIAVHLPLPQNAS